jgi:hypothetical protein
MGWHSAVVNVITFGLGILLDAGARAISDG